VKRYNSSSAGFSFLCGKAVRRKTEIFAWFKEMSGTLAAIPSVRDFRDRHPALVGFARERLSPEGYLGIHLTVGLMVSAVFVWIFGGITEDVLTGDPLVEVDRWVLSRVHYFQSPSTTAFMMACTSLGGNKMISAGALLVFIYLAFTRRFDSLITYLVTMIGGSFLVTVLKTVVHRSRPHAGIPLIQSGGWSFPSGHAMMSIIFYGMLAYLLIRNMQSWKLKVLIVAAAGFIIFVIGLSRLYLEAHYLSDVLAGYVGGLFWLTVAITGIEVYKRFHATREPWASG
jgi:membrane-associated phospholipid phosphatase